MEVFCIPLGLINSSRNVSHQFFSLNVEGAELAILNTILFDIAKIDFIKCRLVDSMYNNISPFISTYRKNYNTQYVMISRLEEWIENLDKNHVVWRGINRSIQSF